jgi:hypothetical protein
VLAIEADGASAAAAIASRFALPHAKSMPRADPTPHHARVKRALGMTAKAVTHSTTHSTGRNKEEALQQKSLQSLIFTQSGRRDLKS